MISVESDDMTHEEERGSPSGRLYSMIRVELVGMISIESIGC